MRRGRIFVLVLGATLVLLFGGGQTSSASEHIALTEGVSVPTCSLRNLSITVVGASAASNQEAMLVGFHNKSRGTCTPSGYPEVVAIRPGASSTAKPSLNIYNGGWTGAAPAPLVVLHHGQPASAIVGRRFP